jgi:hypothetical protein
MTCLENRRSNFHLIQFYAKMRSELLLLQE